MNPPTLSVLLPTYRYARFLPEAIESVLAQDYADFELIVSDDASDDDSADVIRTYAARDARIRAAIHRKNLGMVNNWNWCLREARGTYIKFLFGDDTLASPRALSRMLGLLESEPRAALVASARVILNEASEQIDVWNELGPAGFYEGDRVIVACFQRDRNFVGEPSAVMFRRAAAQRGFDASFRQLVDQEMWFHLLLGGGLVYTPETLCSFRQHPAQQTVVNRAGSVASIETMRLVARYYDHFCQSLGFQPGSFAMRRRLFRHLYYARKDCRLEAVAAAAEAALMPKLGRAWYLLCWALHRITKPWENFSRYLHKRAAASRPPPAEFAFTHPDRNANSAA